MRAKVSIGQIIRPRKIEKKMRKIEISPPPRMTGAKNCAALQLRQQRAHLDSRK
jgi:hypothetical protein